MSWEHLRYTTSFERARRRETFKRLTRIVRGRRDDELVDLDEVKDRLRLFEQTYRGIQPIPVARIVGTTERTSDFDAEFLPRTEELRPRWRGVERAYPSGEFPPIVVYQVGDSYFLVDGHHRVAVARQTGTEYIDAEVTELHARFELPADLDVGKAIHAQQQRLFLEESGLERARPEARVECTRAHGYLELLENVKVHGYHLMTERGEVLSPAEIAGDWYDRVYLPAIDAIRAERLHDVTRGSTDGDLFLWVYERRRRLFPEHGGISLEEAAARARADAGRRRWRRTSTRG
ncbi:MAG TPA: ParB N-terminal domain-containing protein [Actinomycetota bacterium]|nr:ParB N-terminal domain-containing protein [Actinomycetota bacterium]